MDFVTIAQHFNAEIDHNKRKPEFRIACPVCAKTLIVKDYGDPEPALICDSGCSADSILSAIQSKASAPAEEPYSSAAGDAAPHRSPATSRQVAVRESDDPLRKTPPQNIEAEQAVLGAAFLDGEAFNLARSMIGASDFYRESHRIIFQSMTDLVEKGKPIDEVTVIQALRSKGKLDEVGGPSYLIDVIGATPTSAHTKHYAEIIRDMATKRRVAVEMTDIVSMAYNGVSAGALIAELQRRATALDQADLVDPFSQGIQVLTGLDILQRRRTKTANAIVVEDLLRRKETSIWSGKVESGKTTMLRELCMDILRGEPFLGRSCVRGRVLFLMLDADGEELTTKEFEKSGWDPANDTDLRFIFEPSFATRPRAMFELRKTLTEFEPALMVIDPLGRFMQVKDFNDYATTYVMATISDLAKQYDCHIAMPHHIPRGRNDDADTQTAGLGSIVIGGSVNNRFVLTRKPGDIYTIKTSRGKGSGFVPFEGEQVVKRDEDTGRISLVGAYSWKEQAVALKEQVFKLIERSDEPLSATTIGRELGVFRSAAGSAANMLFYETPPRIMREGTGKKNAKFVYFKIVQTSLSNERSSEG